jgi:hypothetical protein
LFATLVDSLSIPAADPPHLGGVPGPLPGRPRWIVERRTRDAQAGDQAEPQGGLLRSNPRGLDRDGPFVDFTHDEFFQEIR